MTRLFVADPTLDNMIFAIDRITTIHYELKKIEQAGTEQELRALLTEMSDMLQLFTIKFYNLTRRRPELRPYINVVSADLTLSYNTTVECAQTLQPDSDIKKVAEFVNNKLYRLVGNLNEIKTLQR